MLRPAGDSDLCLPKVSWALLTWLVASSSFLHQMEGKQMWWSNGRGERVSWANLKQSMLGKVVQGFFTIISVPCIKNGIPKKKSFLPLQCVVSFIYLLLRGDGDRLVLVCTYWCTITNPFWELIDYFKSAAKQRQVL